MSDYKIVYLIVERGDIDHSSYWRVAGSAFVCRDGSLNLKLDLLPGLRFNIRDPKSNAEREDAGEPLPEVSSTARAVPRKPPKEVLDDIPF